VRAFRTHGWLTKVTGCHGQFCQGNTIQQAHAWLWNAKESDQIPPNVENDCGDRCAALAFLHSSLPVTPFSWSGYMSGLMLVFEAPEPLWRHVQCMGVIDAFPSTRVCCPCVDGYNCPYGGGFPHQESTYCGSAPCQTDTCKQLAAGCGVSLFDLAGKANGGDGSNRVGRWGETSWAGHECSQWQVRSGQCGACTLPYWCSDNSTAAANHAATVGGLYGTINTPEQWVDAFYDRDGGRAYGARQCRWQRSQKEQFIDTMRLRMRQRVTTRWPFFDHANPWNEVNFYVDEQGELGRTLWQSLLGLVWVRTAGNAWERRWMLELAANWRRLGHDVPTFEMSAEDVNGNIWNWQDGAEVDLTSEPFNLVEIFS